MGNKMGKLQNTLLNMKLATKQMKRESKKREDASKHSIAQVKKYLKEGKPEVAKIHAENAIRERNEAKNFLILSSRIDAVAQRVQSAIASNNMTKNMQKVVQGMNTVLQNMNVEKISELMEQFEQDNEDLEIRQTFMNESVGQTTLSTTPESQVTELLQQVGDDIGIDYIKQFSDQTPDGLKIPEGEKEKNLDSRFAALNNP